LESGAKTTSLVGLARALSNGWKKFSNTYGETGAQYSPAEPLHPLGQEPKMYDRPWQWQYRVGQNMVITPRQEIPSTISSFQTLRALADNHDITRLCIEIRKEQLSGMRWDIVPEDQDTMVKDGSMDAKQINEIRNFWKKPDRIHSFYDWLGMVLEDILVIDAMTLYKHKTRGGQLWALEPIDGSTIKCLIDDTGHIPLSPLAAYQQILFGYPMGGSEPKTLGFTIDDMVYKPKNLRPFTPYGFPPTEMTLIKVNIALKRDVYFLDYYTKGNMPDGGLMESPENWTADQIQQFQEYWDGMVSGDSGKRAGNLRWVPKGTYHATKEFKFESAFDQWLALVVANAFGINPMHFIKATNRSVGDTQESIQNDIGLKPLQTFLKSIFTDIIQNDLGGKGLAFNWMDQKQEDQKITIEKNVAYVKAGIFGIDEVRAAEGRTALGIPNMVQTANGPVYLTPEGVKAQIDMQVNQPTPVNPQMNPSGGTNEAFDKDGADNEKKSRENADKAGGNDKEAKKVILNEELSKYEKFVLNGLKKNKKRRDFESDIIPFELKKDINTALRKVETPEEIKSIFRLAKSESDDKSAAYKSVVAWLAIQSALKAKAEAYLIKAKKVFMKFAEGAITADKILSLLDDYKFIDDSLGISPMITDLYRLGWDDAKKSVEDLVGEISLNYSEDWAKEHAEELITQLDEATRSMIGETVQSSIKAEESRDELNARLRDNYGFSEARAETIARYESGMVYNKGACQAWKDSGYCDLVDVSDGDGCLTCSEIDGQVWTIDEALDNPLQHPNCVRQFYPRIKTERSEND
jgi:hypothetical protein